MPDEGNGEPDLAKYYPTSAEIPHPGLSEVSLKNLAVVFLLLGSIAVMVNLLMAYLYINQEWVIIRPHTYAAQVGVVLVIFGSIIYIINRQMEKGNAQ